MAKLETRLNGDFDEILNRIETGIMKGSLSASMEDEKHSWRSWTRSCKPS